jgi:hypothetical protein
MPPSPNAHAHHPSPSPRPKRYPRHHTNAPAAPTLPNQVRKQPVSAPALIRRTKYTRGKQAQCRVIRVRTQRMAGRLGLLAPSPLRSAKGSLDQSGVSLIASGV